MKIEKAKIGDATRMQQLINHYASQGEMMARPLSEIYENIRDYFVVRQNGQVVACVAIHIMWSDLAEIKSLAVTEDNQSQGIGDQLVRACLGEAKRIGIPTVFCLTHKSAFFERVGFSRVDKMELPQKVWTECYHCPKFPGCDAIALIYHPEV